MPRFLRPPGSATGKRASAVINSASADQTGWGVSGIAGTALAFSKSAGATTATVNGAVTFDQTTHLNGTWTSTATFIGQNDQTITGTHAQYFLRRASQVVSGATAANTGSGSYLLDGGGYSEPHNDLRRHLHPGSVHRIWV